MSGVMISMSPTVTLKGSIKFDIKKVIGRSEMGVSTYTGPGEILMAPMFLGDITTLRLTGKENWMIGKDAFIAATERVTKDLKNQSVSKAIFSGEGFFVYTVSGNGIIWISSFGAIVRKDVSKKSGCHMEIRSDPYINSCKKVKNTSSITVIWWPGIATTSWSESQVEVSFLATARRKALSASLKALGLCSCKPATLVHFQDG